MTTMTAPGGQVAGQVFDVVEDDGRLILCTRTVARPEEDDGRRRLTGQRQQRTEVRVAGDEDTAIATSRFEQLVIVRLFEPELQGVHGIVPVGSEHDREPW